MPLRVAVIGSSSVYGRMAHQTGGFVARLRRQLESEDAANLVYNLGVVGDTIAGLKNRLGSEVTARAANWLIVYPGFNDICRSGSRTAPTSRALSELSGAISEIVSMATKLAPSIFVSGVPFDESKTAPYTDNKSYYLLADAEKLTEQLRLICKQKKVPYLDIFERWRGRDSWDFLAADGLHLNENGHLMLFEEVREALGKLA